MVFLAGCSLLIPFLLPGYRGEMTQQTGFTNTRPAGHITPDTTLIQEIRVKKEYIYGIELYLATWSRLNSNTSEVAILDSNLNVLFRKKIRSPDVKDNSYFPVLFGKALKTGEGGRIFICISSHDGNEANSITAWIDTSGNSGALYRVSLKDRSPGKADLTKDHRLPGTLMIRTYESGHDYYLWGRILLWLIAFGIALVIVFFGELKSKLRLDHVKAAVITCLFIAWISLPPLYFFLVKTKDILVSQRENRVFAKPPVFAFAAVSNLPGACSDYYNDYFPAREGIITLHSRIVYDVFRKSPYPIKVIVGKKGWLYKPGERAAFEGKRNVTQAQIDSIARVLHDRTLWYRGKGIRFYIAVGPMKTDVYREYLPDYYVLSSKPLFTDRITETLQKDTVLRLIDLKPSLVNAKKEWNVYFITDFHWSELGAYTAYVAIMKRIQQDYPAIRIMTHSDFSMGSMGNQPGNQSREIGLENYLTEPFFYFRMSNPVSRDGEEAGYKPPAGFGHPDLYELVKVNADTSLPRIVVIRDSFFHLLPTLMGESFGKSVYIWDAWQYGLNSAIIGREKPDIVLLVAYEAFLPNILTPAKDMNQ
jgi:alginate O-acetyltransferase complex protein AlgJ